MLFVHGFPLPPRCCIETISDLLPSASAIKRGGEFTSPALPIHRRVNRRAKPAADSGPRLFMQTPLQTYRLSRISSDKLREYDRHVISIWCADFWIASASANRSNAGPASACCFFAAELFSGAS